MRYAIISDIHANLEALETVIAFIKKMRLTGEDIKILCLGDIVDYGPQPIECIEIVAKECHAVVMGNHDHSSSTLIGLEEYNQYAARSARWTERRLTPEHKAYLLSLPYEIHYEGFSLVHASPDNPEKWYYVMDRYNAQEAFAAMPGRITFIGHSHVPGYWYQISKRKFEWVSTTPDIPDAAPYHAILNSERRYIINVGSVGQPRDRDLRACFVLYDDNPTAESVVWFRLPYDVTATVEKIKATNLPEQNHTRLLSGW